MEHKPFQFENWQQELLAAADRKLELSNTETILLQSLATNNGPLTRVQGFFIDYARQLSENVFECDVTTEAGKAQFITLKAQYHAIMAQKELWEAILTPTQTAETEQ